MSVFMSAYMLGLECVSRFRITLGQHLFVQNEK